MVGFKSKTWLDAKGVSNAVKQASIQPIHKMALLVEREAKTSMTKGGRIRSRDRTTGKFSGSRGVPSKPPDPPNVQTSNLRGSIQNAPTNRGTYLVGPTLMAWYGKIHEFGDSTHPKRPFMRPALHRSAAKFPHMFKNLPLRDTLAARRIRQKGELK
jgi:HK97 gp10 family phage protein